MGVQLVPHGWTFTIEVRCLEREWHDGASMDEIEAGAVAWLYLTQRLLSEGCSLPVDESQLPKGRFE